MGGPRAQAHQGLVALNFSVTNTGGVCSANLGAAFIGPGQTQTFSATFGAPPPGVRSVDVAIPHLATFSDVPLG